MMNFPLAEFWHAPNGSGGLWGAIIGATLAGFALMIAFLYAPPRLRPIIVGAFTFVAGLYWVAFYLWPAPYDKKAGDIPLNMTESVGFYLADAADIVGGFTNVLTAFLLGLGVFSLLKIHSAKVIKQQKDWGFSLVLILSAALMTAFGYMVFISNRDPAVAAKMELEANWLTANYGKDFLFDGLLQQMEAAMFSIIAFYILSAAYRAFRIRSIESTIMLTSALILMLSLMGGVEYLWGQLVNSGGKDTAFSYNYTLSAVAQWLRDNFQTPSLRAIDFGIGLGWLAMGLRLWLGIEKPGVSS